MNIVLGFDEETLRRYEGRNSPLLFSIVLEDDGQVFPEDGWLDFGCVILGWWIGAVLRMSAGTSEEELAFMDGPFTLIATRTEERLNIRSSEGDPFLAATTLSSFSSAVRQAANEALRHMSEAGVSGDDVRALDIALRELQKMDISL